MHKKINKKKAFRIPAALLAGALLAGLAMPATAGSPDGRLQVKLLGTAVLPDGGIDKVYYDGVPLPAGSGTRANNNVVPTVAIEYFATPELSIETICCITRHKVYGEGAIYGTELLTRGHIIPATVTLKYHIPVGAGIKPYLGVGPSVFLFLGEKPGKDLRALGADSVNLKTGFGAALQAGVDIPVNSKGLGVSLDAKRYFMKSTLRVRDGAGVELLRSRHTLDPWVLSAGVAYRF